ncbi:MAG: hypothetical protein ACLFS0_01860 [Bacteroidales bacterium]
MNVLHSVYKKFISHGRSVMVFLSVVFLMGGCDSFDLRSDETLLAKAYGSRLYLEDLPDLVPDGASVADSADLVRRYVDRWVNQQIFLHHAMESLPDEKVDFQRQVREYENSLWIHAYENDLVSREMDTVVTEQELHNYYEGREEQFPLRDHIVQATYVKLPLGASDAAQVRSLYRSDDEEDIERLDQYSLQQAAAYSIEPAKWMLFNEILTDMPIEENPSEWLRNNRSLEISDDYYRYFLYIHDYRLRGDISPFDFAKNNIKMLVLNQRRKDFIQQKRRDLFNNAFETNQVETLY